MAFHEDLAVSGGTDLDKRPGLLAALEALRTEGAGVLVVAKRDRLARDVLVSAMVERLCERSGARLTSACGVGNGTGPEAQLLRGIMDVFAAYERAIMRVGTIPYGYRLAPDGKHLEEDPAEQATAARARMLRTQGGSLRGIGRTLLDEGAKPRNGRSWHVQVVKRLVAP